MRLKHAALCLFALIAVSFGGETATGEEGAQARGVELLNRRGPLTARYFWRNEPNRITVVPVSWLGSPGEYPSFSHIKEQNWELDRYGFGADVLQLNPNDNSLDLNNWERNYFLDSDNNRPFFVLYEHIFGTRYNPENGPKDMSDPHNRRIFLEDIEKLVVKVIRPNLRRYVTVNGRPVIYLWASDQMHSTGEWDPELNVHRFDHFAKVLREAKTRWNVFFLGGGEIGCEPYDLITCRRDTISRVEALDGFMPYNIGVSGNYSEQVRAYEEASCLWRFRLNRMEERDGIKRIFIPTFTPAFDDSRLEERDNPPMYPASREEVVAHARFIRENRCTLQVKKPEGGFDTLEISPVYDTTQPLTIYDELYEGSALIQSVCPRIKDNGIPVPWLGCGVERLKLAYEQFVLPQLFRR